MYSANFARTCSFLNLCDILWADSWICKKEKNPNLSWGNVNTFAHTEWIYCEICIGGLYIWNSHITLEKIAELQLRKEQGTFWQSFGKHQSLSTSCCLFFIKRNYNFISPFFSGCLWAARWHHLWQNVRVLGLRPQHVELQQRNEIGQCTTIQCQLQLLINPRSKKYLQRATEDHCRPGGAKYILSWS